MHRWDCETQMSVLLIHLIVNDKHVSFSCYLSCVVTAVSLWAQREQGSVNLCEFSTGTTDPLPQGERKERFSRDIL